MSKVIKMESKLSKTDKPSIIKDENGYYKVALGALNTYNDNGIFYKIEDLAYHTSKESVLGGRINMGIVRSEYKHPDFDGLTQKELINKIIVIDMDRVCGHLKSIEFVNLGRSEKGWEGYPIYNVYGWIKPEGPFGKYLEEYLENPDENVSLSIRSAVNQTVVGFTTVRTVLEISTWDFVGEQGYKMANQWNAVGIESKVHNEAVICLDGTCIPKLKKIAAGTESVNTSMDLEKIANRLNDEIKDNNTIFDW